MANDNTDIQIEIDGRTLTAKPNQTVIQVADEAGIYIPRFCYHKHLSIPANCRMCLVEVEKAPKALPACATPVAPGMKVFTRSQKTLLAQRAVMEFLLINHPLDCPICDQGGECELQDLSMGYGATHSRYNECKRSVEDENLGPLIATEMTRCIQCTRCIRFGDEIAGMRELGMTYRGEGEEVTTFVEQSMKSEVSGNIIDLCPVGALTSKPYRFTARAWELDQAPSISPHDCLGSNLNVHTRYGTVMRVVARENMAVNQTWISDRDRFSYTGLYHPDRLEEPMIKVDGEWRTVDWHQAFTVAASALQSVIAEHGADEIGTLASASSTLEEFYLLQKILRALGSSERSDQENKPAFPGLGISLADLETCDAILLIGSNLQKEQPLAALRVRKAALNGASVLAINSVDYDFNFKLAGKLIIAPHQVIKTLNDLLNASDSNEFAQQLKNRKKIHIILGAQALQNPEATQIYSLVQQIAAQYNASAGVLTKGANAAGAWLASKITGGDAGNVLHKPRRAYVLLNVEPEFDCDNAQLATEAVKQAQCVVALSLFRNPVLDAHAHVILPMAAFTETSGTYVNTQGMWQSFKGVAKPFGASRPGWKILRVLGNFLQLDGFDYESSEQVRDEVKMQAEAVIARPKAEAIQSAGLDCFASLAMTTANLSRIGETPLYAIDSLTRRAQPLQEAQTVIEGDVSAMRIHPETASKYHLQQGDEVRVKQAQATATFITAIDERIAKDAVWIAAGIAASSNLGDLFGEVEIEKV